MEALNGATIFWLITLGMLAGAAVKLFMWNTTINLPLNVGAGTVGSLIVGSITIGFGLPGGLLFSFIGTLAVLFIVNVFNIEREEAAEVAH